MYLPHGAKRLKILTDPVSPDRRVTADEASWLLGPGHQYVWPAVGGVLLSQARHATAHDPWVFIPGREGLIVAAPSALFLTGGSYEDALQTGGELLRCQHIEPFNFRNCQDADGGHMDFYKLAPSWVRSGRVGGRCFTSHHGVIVGTLSYRAFDIIDRDFIAANRRWRHRSATAAHC